MAWPDLLHPLPRQDLNLGNTREIFPCSEAVSGPGPRGYRAPGCILSEAGARALVPSASRSSHGLSCFLTWPCVDRHMHSSFQLHKHQVTAPVSSAGRSLFSTEVGASFNFQEPVVKGGVGDKRRRASEDGRHREKRRSCTGRGRGLWVIRHP